MKITDKWLAYKKALSTFLEAPFYQPSPYIGLYLNQGESNRRFLEVGFKKLLNFYLYLCFYIVCEKPSLETFKNELKEYEQVIESLKGLSNCQFLPVGEGETQVFRTFESQIENPKIYS